MNLLKRANRKSRIFAAGALAVLALVGSGAARADDQPWPDIADPPSFSPKDGVTTIALTTTNQPVRIGPVTFPGVLLNGIYTAPVIHARPGDHLAIHLTNQLRQPTNLHYHGLQTSPLGNSDNAYVIVPPGQSFDYDVKIPASQPPGTYWYHSHVHGSVEGQVMGGLSGALIIDGFADQFPPLKDVTERLFVLKEFEWEDSEDPFIDGYLHDRLQTINGQLGVTVRMRPGETQLWHIVSVAPNKIFHLTLPGHRFRILGQDGVARNREESVETLDITPGGRFEVLVDAGDAGSYNLKSEKVLTGSERSRILAHVLVAGEPTKPIPTIERFPAREDLRDATIDTKRTVIFTQDSGTERFFIDGQLFDHGRVDFRVPLGSIQEWKLVNKTGDFHEFHIHQVHFQIVAVNDKPVPFDGLQDTVRIPEQGSVTVRLAFTRPEIVGRFFYHCHVLRHEDKGMMAAVEVYDPNAPVRSSAPEPEKKAEAPIGVRAWLASLTGGQSRPEELPYAWCGLNP
jgi:suppressor of ftsI